jgi:hypothetical protein
MHHGCTIMTQKQTVFFATEDAIPSANEQIAPSSQQHKVNADHFSDIREIVRKKLFPPGQTVNGKFTAWF